MADFDFQDTSLPIVRRRAQRASHVQHAQTMLVAAGICAFGIVAVAATMMSTLF